MIERRAVGRFAHAVGADAGRAAREPVELSETVGIDRVPLAEIDPGVSGQGRGNDGLVLSLERTLDRPVEIDRQCRPDPADPPALSSDDEGKSSVRRAGQQTEKPKYDTGFNQHRLQHRLQRSLGSRIAPTTAFNASIAKATSL